jgi:hypothetical protein
MKPQFSDHAPYGRRLAVFNVAQGLMGERNRGKSAYFICKTVERMSVT